MHIKYVNRYVANKPSLKICNEMQRSVSFKTEKEKKVTAGDAGDRTRGLSHAKRTRYHCATSPDMKTCPEKELINSL